LEPLKAVKVFETFDFLLVLEALLIMQGFISSCSEASRKRNFSVRSATAAKVKLWIVSPAKPEVYLF
jgi:hypothetical protein